MTIPLDTVLPEIVFNKPFTLSKVEWFIFYLCSCLSTQFLYRTTVNATFNVKNNIKDIIKIVSKFFKNILSDNLLFMVRYYHKREQLSIIPLMYI